MERFWISCQTLGRVIGVECVDVQYNKAFEAESFEQCHLSKLDCMN